MCLPPSPYRSALNWICRTFLLAPVALLPLSGQAQAPKEVHLQDLHTFPVTPVAKASSKGPANAKVTVIEFTDYTCPFCLRVEPTFRKVMAENANQVHFVIEHHWIPRHKNARLAAHVALAASLQGKFWPVHDMLFEKHFAAGAAGATIDGYVPYLKTIAGLDVERLKKDVDSPEVNSELDAELKSFKSDSTPEFLINGHLHTGQLTEEQFNQLIKEAQQ
jgi:protein-disulfide isomerase